MAWFIAVAIWAFLQTASSEVLYENTIKHGFYDYIIVGSGSSGAVIANRLSEDSQNTVLLLEAGGPPPELSEIPLLAYQLTGTDVDWKYETVPQKNACLAYPHQTNPMPRGKALGGTSDINCMLYVRGNHEDFNDWSRQGAQGWSYDEVLYYFLKSEDQTNFTLLQDGYHRSGGPLTVSSTEFQTHLRDVLIEAGAENGYDIVDYNGEKQIGLGNIQANIRNGARCSTEKAYLRPAANRKNLDILYNAFVTKVNIDNGVACSVNVDFKGVSRTAYASKEIVLSAGAIGSPQILMLSGIGPKEHLEDLKIPVVADLPVGDNLQDHIREQGLLYYFNQSVSLVFSRDVKEKAYEEFKLGKGPLTVPCGVEVLGFIKTKYQNGADQRPDIQIPFLAPVVYPDSNENKLMNASVKDVLAVFPTLLRPQSRGVIKLNSSNPYDYPLIDPKYLTQEKDVLRMVEGVRIAKTFMDSPAIQKYHPELRRPRVAGCDTPDMDSDEYLQCVVRGLTHTADHQCCTCKMGDPRDPTTVVDSQLRVKGVKNLRVADASIMPSVTSGNTNAPCIMIGEKAADLILGREWDPTTQQLVRI